MTGLWEVGGAVALAHQARQLRYTARAEQQMMAEAVTTALGRGRPGKTGLAMIEAGTGIGKTLAYLVPGALHIARTGGRMLVSTQTLALSAQIAERDGPMAIDVAAAQAGKRLRIAELRGRRNFPSASRAQAIATLLKADGMPKSAWEPYAEIAARAEVASRAAQAVLDQAGSGNIPAGAYMIVHNATIDALEHDLGLAVERDDIRLLPSCPEDEAAIYDLGRRLAAGADVLVTTHATTAIALARRMLPGAGHDASFEFLVLDEADLWALSAAAATMASISLDSLTRSVQRLMEVTRDVPSVRELAIPAVDLLGRIDELRSTAPDRPGQTVEFADAAQSIEFLHNLGRDMRHLAEKASAAPDRTASATGALHSLCDEVDRATRALASNIGSGFWRARWQTSRVTGAPSIVVAPRAPGRLLKRIWTPAEGSTPLAETVLLTSASLSTPGFAAAARWTAIETATGIHIGGFDLVHADLCLKLHPQEFGSLELRFADPNAAVPRVSADGSISAEAASYARSVVMAAHQAGGRVLVLVPSYADVALYAALEVKPLILHRPDTALREALQAYRDDPRACLVTPAGWVGIDLPGMVDQLVIPRLPFPPRSDAEDDGGHFPSLLAAMLSKLTQGIGRAIRRHDDRATLWFADPRMPLPQELVDRMLEDPAELAVIASAQESNAAYLAAIPERFHRGMALARIGVRLSIEDHLARAASGGRHKGKGDRR